MSINRQIYNFAAKAGALEGWVYRRDLDVSYLSPWIDHIVDSYAGLPADVRDDIQSLCDETIGRTIQSLLPILGDNHELIGRLKGITVGALPASPDDFPKRRSNQ